MTGLQEISVVHLGKEVSPFNTLLFGLRVAPRIFTLFLKPAVACLRNRGPCLPGRLARPHAVAATGQEVTSLLEYLGWVVNYNKTDISGTQIHMFL